MIILRASIVSPVYVQAVHMNLKQLLCRSTPLNRSCTAAARSHLSFSVLSRLLFSRGKLPGFAHVYLEGFVTDLIQFDADPSARADIWRLEVGFRSIFNQRLLKTGRRREPHREMTVIVVIVHEH